MLFADFSVRRVPLKKLWELKWHKTYSVTGPFTRAGGASAIYLAKMDATVRELMPRL